MSPWDPQVLSEPMWFLDVIFTKGPKVDYVELNAWNRLFGASFSDVCDLGDRDLGWFVDTKILRMWKMGWAICHCCEDGIQIAKMDSLPFLLETCYYQTSIRGFQVPQTKHRSFSRDATLPKPPQQTKQLDPKTRTPAARNFGSSLPLKEDLIRWRSWKNNPFINKLLISAGELTNDFLSSEGNRYLLDLYRRDIKALLNNFLENPKKIKFMVSTCCLAFPRRFTFFREPSQATINFRTLQWLAWECLAKPGLAKLAQQTSNKISLATGGSGPTRSRRNWRWTGGGRWYPPWNVLCTWTDRKKHKRKWIIFHKLFSG